jgi:hypothetical protein
LKSLGAPEVSEEEKLLQFLQGKTGWVRINELLKSLYGVPKFTEPAKWLQQGENKRLRGLLQRLIDEGKLTVKDSRHTQLGKFYYNDDNVQQHYNIHNTVIEAAPKTD